MTTIETFITGISAEPQPLLANAKGTLLFEIRDGDDTTRWLVAIDKGRIAIEPGSVDAEADATVRGERALLRRVLTGEANAMAAILRGEIEIDGDASLLVLVQRIFPGPQGVVPR